MNDDSKLATGLPDRPADAHKGTFGRVLLIAGSNGMSGAAVLAGLGALRAGAGLVSLAIPAGIQSIVASHEPGYMTIPLPETEDGRISADAIDNLSSFLAGADAIGVGPGLSSKPETESVVTAINRTVTQPVVLDADALNALARSISSGAFQREAVGPRILTPHPGEFARLTGQSVSSMSSDRQTRAASLASESMIVVLKGSGTVVTDGSRVAVNETGNSGMATGGSGDVLTGVITALCGQKMEPFEAARLGVRVHGLAGDLAAAKLSEPGLIASDLPRFLGPAWQRLYGST